MLTENEIKDMQDRVRAFLLNVDSELQQKERLAALDRLLAAYFF